MSTTEDPMVVSRLCKSYAHKPAVQDCSLSVPRGAVHGLLGPNGSGKTTTLHILCGLLTPDSGSVLIGGDPVEDPRSRASLGFAPDDLPLPEYLTGREYLEFHDRLRQRDDGGRAGQLAEVLGIEEDLDQLVSTYSHGMKRKLQIVAATMHNPAVVVLDEPFRGLDPQAAATLHRLVEVLREAGTAVLIATHDMLRAERDCDRVTVLARGSVVATGTPRELIESTAPGGTLEDVFLRLTGSEKEFGRRQRELESIFT